MNNKKKAKLKEIRNKNKKSTITKVEINYSKDFLVRGIYFLMDNNKKVVYVGMSKHNCLNRISSHFDNLDKEFCSFKIIPYVDLSDKQLLLKEKQYIKTMKPKYNVVHNK